ncbi:lipopolysaccharide biosynthesis protein [Arthrobacter sp. MDT2-2]
MKIPLKRLLGFSALPLISSLTPLLLLPVVARIGGVEGWASVALGQSVGAFGAIVVGYGLHISGPAAIIEANSLEDQRQVYSDAISARLLLLSIVLPVCAFIAWLLGAESYKFDSLMMSLAMLMNGISPAWYLIGLGRPGSIAKYETIPKMAATLLSLILLLVTGLIWLYPLALCGATWLGLLTFHKRYFGTYAIKKGPKQSTAKYLLQNGKIAATAAIGSAYVATPVPVGSLSLTYSGISSLSSADRLYRYGLFTVVALGNAMQSWVLEQRSTEGRQANSRIAVMCHGLLGLAGCIFLSFFGELATEVIFGQQVASEQSITLWYGFAFLFVSLSTPLIRNTLIPAGRQNTVLALTIVSALIGLPVMVLGSMSLGAPGIGMGLATSEFIILAGAALSSAPKLWGSHGT